MRRRLGALAFAAWSAAFAASTPPSAAAPTVVAARWSRHVVPMPHGPDPAPLFALLDNGNVLLRSGRTLAAIDARTGATRWSLPNVEDASAAGAIVLVRRKNIVFAVRSSDSAVIWKHRCVAPPYAVPVGKRVVTICAGRSVVLDAKNGAVLAQTGAHIPTRPSQIEGARALNRRYALVTTFFEGAWMGRAYSVVDAMTGAFLWSETDLAVLDVTGTTIDITPLPSMLPWSPAGTVVRRRLADGATIARHAYALPGPVDGYERGLLSVTRGAAYLAVPGALLRYCLGQYAASTRVVDGSASVSVVLGASAFIRQFNVSTGRAHLYFEHPDGRGGFALRSLGWSLQRVAAGGDVGGDVAVRAGDRAVMAVDGVLSVYDESGSAVRLVKPACLGMPRVLASKTAAFVFCEHGSVIPTLSAYPLRDSRPG